MPGETEAAPNAPPEPAPIASEETDIAGSLPTAEEAAGWLGRTKPSAVTALLKDPDYRAAIIPAFNGVRPDAKSFALPLVRSRLALAASKDAKLAEKLRSLFEAAQILPPVSPSAETKPAKAVPFSPPPPDPLPALRAERDARRRERDAARIALAAAAAERDAAAKARLQAEGERDEAQKLAKKQAERIARLERQMAQAKQTEARLVKALNEDKVSPPPAPRPRTGPAQQEQSTVSAAWPAAVRHLLNKEKFSTALALAEDVLKSESEDLDALQIAAEASERHKEPRQAISYARRLLMLQSRRPDIPAAGETLLTIFRLLPAPDMAELDVRVFLAALTPTDSAAVLAARLMLGRLRGLSPNTHAWLAGYIAERTTLAPVLIPPPEALGPDDPLPLALRLGRPVTARHLADAVDQMQTALVGAARATLAALDADTAARVWAALEQAAADDPARLLPLRRTPRGAAVVDGSNVAWFDQEALVHGKPRLRPLLAMRRMLWSRGFFPVVLYADANLPYFIDDRPGLLALRDRRALTFVDAGTAADEVLLRVAKQMNAPLITNDKMEDWDPEGEVRKARYTVSMNGEAHLLSEV